MPSLISSNSGLTDQSIPFRLEKLVSTRHTEIRGSFKTSYRGHLGRATPPQNLEFE